MQHFQKCLASCLEISVYFSYFNLCASATIWKYFRCLLLFCVYLALCGEGLLHMSPVTRKKFVVCSYGKFKPGYWDEK